MNARELRIDNWILPVGVFNLEEKPTQLTLNMMAQICHLPNGEVTDFKPIPLTEEWLLKFGFEKVPDKWITIESFHYENENCWIYLIEKGFELELNTGDERHNLYRTYKYVHQLQNLHFALTGEELQLKE